MYSLPVICCAIGLSTRRRAEDVHQIGCDVPHGLSDATPEHLRGAHGRLHLPRCFGPAGISPIRRRPQIRDPVNRFGQQQDMPVIAAIF
jgi:hypothetical protein